MDRNLLCHTKYLLVSFLRVKDVLETSTVPQCGGNLFVGARVDEHSNLVLIQADHGKNGSNISVIALPHLQHLEIRQRWQKREVCEYRTGAKAKMAKPAKVLSFDGG